MFKNSLDKIFIIPSFLKQEFGSFGYFIKINFSKILLCLEEFSNDLPSSRFGNNGMTKNWLKLFIKFFSIYKTYSIKQ